MYKLDSADMKQMIADAARVLTQPRDKEIMQRLVIFTQNSPEHDWDKRLIATMLARAGKMHEAEMVLHDIELAWQRADACLSMAKGLSGDGDPDSQVMNLLNIGVIEAQQGQKAENVPDRLDADSVLGDIAIMYAELDHWDKANTVVELISDVSRRQHSLQKIAQYAPPPPPLPVIVEEQTETP